MAETQVLIIGQGISGTMLSWFLEKEGISYIILDNGQESTSSKIAAGLINPVTGRRYVMTWMIEELISFAKSTYAEFSDHIDIPLIFHKSIVDFFPSIQMLEAFTERVDESCNYLHPYPNQNDFNDLFNYSFGCGQITPVYMINMKILVSEWRKRLVQGQKLREEAFRIEYVNISPSSIVYQDIRADKIIFCDGIESMNNPWFKLLPFSPNKGESLLLEIEGLPDDKIFKKGMSLIPLPSKNLYWFGSTYLWEFEDPNPSTLFLNKAKNLLDNWLKLPYKIIEQKAAIRPATLERRPFVGFHPFYQNVGILNGMGTKGASLAPYFAHQLVHQIVHQLPIDGEANINRFNRILLK